MNDSRTIGSIRFLAAVLALLSLLSLFPLTAQAAEETAAEPLSEETVLPEEEFPAEEIAEEADLAANAENGAESESAQEPAAEPAEEADAAGEAQSAEPAQEAIEDEPGLDAAANTSPFKTDANGNRYYIDPNTGYRKTGWLKLNGLWYYFWSDGTMATGWCYANDGYWYYFNKETGVVHRGWITTTSGDRYYMRPEDAREQTGWRKIDGKWYYFWSDGKMATGWVLANDGYWYYFDKDTGVVHRGWITTKSGYTYYMRPEDATEQKGWRQIDGYWYYFGNDGRMRTGWQYVNGYKYYFAKKDDGTGYPVGSNVYNVTVDGYWVNQYGYTTATWSVWERMVRVAEFESSTSEYLIIVDTDYCKVGVFQGSKGNWEGIYYWDCTPGKSSTPTVKGIFTINSKGQYFYGANTGCRCWYWSEFCGGDYAFHSVLYTPSGTSIQDGRLGMRLSHGCVRLDINNAYWIYENAPIGTTVIVY